MYPYEQKVDITTKLKTTIVIFKICLCICLFLLGVYVTLWTIGTLNQLINHSENVSLIKSFFDLQSSQQVIDIVVNREKIVIKDNGILIWVILILIFIILFNVIGRIISGIFSSIVSILANLNLDTLKSDKDKK